MSKKDFKNNINDLFKDNEDDIKQVNSNGETPPELKSSINLDEITDEKVKWLLIKLMRYEKELKLWRTGALTVESFEESLSEHNLMYDAQTNEIKQME